MDRNYGCLPQKLLLNGPASPDQFETIETGWQLIGTVKRIEGGLIEFRGMVRHIGVTLQQGVFGERAGPIVTERKGLLGKTKDVTVTENRALMGAKSVTDTPLIIRAKPGVVYSIEVTAFGETSPARISFGADKKDGKNAILKTGVTAS